MNAIKPRSLVVTSDSVHKETESGGSSISKFHKPDSICLT